MPSRIILLTQWFDPEPTFKGLVFAKALVKQGFDVEVITGFPNYPGGKLYAGFKLRPLQHENVEGIKVTRLLLYPSHNKSSIQRSLNYISFAVAALFYSLFKIKRSDIIYAYHPPLTVGVVAGLIRVVKGAKVVYDIQDMWPDTLRATGMLSSRSLLSLISKICNWVYRHVDVIVVLSPGFKRILIERGVAETKIDIIYNWADEVALISRKGNLPFFLSGGGNFHIVFAGNMGKAQGLDNLLLAAELLQSWNSSVRFLMIGTGVELLRLKEKVLSKRLENIKFISPVPMTEIGLILSAADALLVHLKKDPLFEITIPSKTQAYMFIGKPILMAAEGDAANLIKESGAGFVVDSENPQALAEAANALANMPEKDLKHMGEQAKSFYNQELALNIGVRRFSDIFRRLL